MRGAAITAIVLGSIGFAAIALVVGRSHSAEPLLLPGVAETVEIGVDLGPVYNGASATHVTPVRNGSGGLLRLIGSSSCGCTSVFIDREVLQPQEVGLLTVRYDSTKRPNQTGITREQFVVSDAGPTGRTPVVVGLASADVQDTLTFDTSALTWERHDVTNERSRRNFSVRNSSRYPITIESATIDSEAASWSVQLDAHLLQPNQQTEIAIGVDEVHVGGPVAVDLTIESSLAAEGGPVALKHRMPLRVLNRPPVSAIPGSLVFVSEAETQELALQIHQPERVHVHSVTTEVAGVSVRESSPARYAVEVVVDGSAKPVQGHLTVNYTLDGRSGGLEVPIVVMNPRD